MIRHCLAATCLLTSASFAQESNVTVGSVAAKIGAEFRGEMIYDNKGFDAYDGFDPEATTSTDVTRMRILLGGKINPDVDFKFRFDMLSSDLLQYGYGTYNMNAGSTKLGLSIGKMKVQQGGWDQKNNAYSDHVQGYYKKHLAFSSYEPMVAFAADIAGKVTLQLVNDVTTDDGGEWNTKQHPTAVVGWYGDLGMFDPNIEYGSYDNNKSSWLGIGLQVKADALKGTFDYKGDRISNKVTEGTKARSKEDTATSLTLKVAYTVKSVATPWFYFSSYDKAQYEDAASGKKDAKVNEAQFNADGKFVYSVNDNAQVIGLGADLESFGKNWVPFIALTSTSAKFANPKDATKEEAKTATTLALGCYGAL
jgi:hypothetical protein